MTLQAMNKIRRGLHLVAAVATSTEKLPRATKELVYEGIKVHRARDTSCCRWCSRGREHRVNSCVARRASLFFPQSCRCSSCTSTLEILAVLHCFTHP